MNPSYVGKDIPDTDAYDHLGQTPLTAAIIYEDTAEVRALLDRGADPDVLNARNYTALEVAASQGKADIVRLLLDIGADPRKGSPFYYAKTDEIKKLLLDAGADPDAKNNDRRIMVSFPGQADAIQEVLDAERASGRQTDSVVMSVILGRDCARITELVQAGASINETHDLLYMPLIQVFEQRRSAELLQCVLELGAEPDKVYKHKDPFSMAIASSEDDALLMMQYGAFRQRKVEHMSQAVKNDRLRLLSAMIAEGGDVNGRVDSMPLLFLAVGKPEIFRLLLDNGANAGAVYDGVSLLAEVTDEASLLLLIEKGADVNHPSIFKRHDVPVLHLAMLYDSHKMFDAALKAGANIHGEDEFGTLPLERAVRKGEPYYVDKLLRAGAKVNGSVHPKRTYYVDYAGKIYSGEDDLLAIAVSKGDVAIVQLLIDYGVNLNARANIYERRYPVHIAVSKGDKELVNALVSAGAKLNVADRYKQTPLHYAAEAGAVEIAEILLAAGIKVDAFDEDRATALHIAVRHGDEAMVKLLMSYKANPHLADKHGDTAVSLADDTIARLLENK